MVDAKDLTPREARLAAEYHAEIGMEHVAGVYAQALLGAAESPAQVDTVLEEFDSLLVEVFDAFPRLEAVLGSLRVSHPDKSQVLDKVLAGQASPMFLHFLKVVSRHGRLDCLRAIHAQARLLRDRSSGRVRVQLATAAPIDAAQLAAITAELRQRLGAEPVIEQVTQPELIGGAVVRVGDVVYDGSVANGFKIVREKMIQRSVHEIQSRRDRFRDSTGD